MNLDNFTKLIRYDILLQTTSAGSGHVTSSFSAVELMTSLFYKHFHYDLNDPQNPSNDRLIFSKGHATPLLYALWAAAGKLTEEELKSYRDFDGRLEGHPSMRFPYTVAPTGSLGQGLSVGLGIAINDKYLDKKGSRTYVLLGDGEMAEGQVWEALQVAGHYKLNNLVAVLDVNRLGQSGETMLGHSTENYETRIKSFGWRTYVVSDGHNLDEINKAYETVLSWSNEAEEPIIIIAKTIKGKGVSFLEDKSGWHGKALSGEEFEKAVEELGEIDKIAKGEVKKPEVNINLIVKTSSFAETSEDKQNSKLHTSKTIYNTSFTRHLLGEKVATRKAYGTGLVRLGKIYPNVVALDGDVKNSTFSEDFAKAFPERYFEMYIAEQNMVSCALGLATQEKVPFVSTFAAFLTRANDQVRMANLAGKHIVFCGSHAGVSIGEDGPSQMGLTDMAMFRSELGTTIFYPCDAVSTERLLEEAYKVQGIVYIRTTRPATPVIYGENEKFNVGGSKVLRGSEKDKATLITAGITVHEALKAADELEKMEIKVRVIDCYSIKPIDREQVMLAAKETGIVIAVEDHSNVGGLGDAVLEALSEAKDVKVYKMAVSKLPRSGTMEELLEYEEIDSGSIVEQVVKVLA